MRGRWPLEADTPNQPVPEENQMIRGIIGLLFVGAIVLFLVKVAFLGGIIGLIALILLVLLILGRI